MRKIGRRNAIERKRETGRKIESKRYRNRKSKRKRERERKAAITKNVMHKCMLSSMKTIRNLTKEMIARLTLTAIQFQIQ